MAANEETNVRIRLTADTRGGDEAVDALGKVGTAAGTAAKDASDALGKVGDAAESGAEKSVAAARETAGEVEKVGKAAKNAAAETAGAANLLKSEYQRVAGAVNACKSAIGGITKAMGLVGWAVEGVRKLIEAYEKLKAWLDRDRKAAEELARTVRESNAKAAVEASAAAYAKLNAQLAETLRMETARDKLADRRLAQTRAAEDAQDELDMQKELSGLDREDPEYQQNADLVRSKYARQRAEREARRATEDTVREQNRLRGQAEEKTAAADELEKDVNGKSGDAVIALKKQIASEKDEGARKNLEEQLDKLLAEQRKKIEEARKLRQEAEELLKEAAALSGADRAAQIRQRATNVEQDAADADTRKEIEKRRKERKDAAEDKRLEGVRRANQYKDDGDTVREGEQKIAELDYQMFEAEGRKQDAEDKYAKEAADVQQAQDRYDMLQANGGSRKERSAALAALQKERAEAEEAKHEMERVAAQVAATLTAITAQIKALQKAVDDAKGRRASYEADAPAGS